jgi:hypothetical protein
MKVGCDAKPLHQGPPTTPRPFFGLGQIVTVAIDATLSWTEDEEHRHQSFPGDGALPRAGTSPPQPRLSCRRAD